MKSLFNFVRNSGLEVPSPTTGREHLPSYWYNWKYSKSNMVLSYPEEGMNKTGKSVKIHAPEIEMGKYAIWETQLYLDFTKKYTIAGNVKTENLKGTVQIGIRWKDKNDVKIFDENPIIIKDENLSWKEFTAEVMPPKNTESAWIRLQLLDGSGSVYFDNLSVQETGTYVPIETKFEIDYKVILLIIIITIILSR